MTADLHSSYAGWPEAIGIDWERSAWPDYAQTWMGSTMYPAGRSQDKPQRGWVCSGCGAGWAPWVASCGHCKPQAKPAVAEPQVMGEWGDET